MQNYVCFNLNSPSIIQTNLSDNYIILYTKRNITIEPENQYVTISRLFNYDYNYKFNDYGRIGNVELMEDYDKSKIYQISLVPENKLPEENKLSDLIYSLLKISNYIKPYKHFNRSYTFLDELDYYTIVNQRIFISRTSFGKILNSLPTTHIIKYLQKLLELEGLNFFTSRDYNTAISLLEKYITTEIENRGRLLISCEKLIIENMDKLINYENIGFLSDEDQKSDYLSKQVIVFKELLNKDKENIWDLIQDEIRRNEDEVYFNRKFNKKEWPIKSEVF